MEHKEEEVKKLGLFAGIVLELFYQDCLGLFAPPDKDLFGTNKNINT